jgi:hypothetical protein
VGQKLGQPVQIIWSGSNKLPFTSTIGIDEPEVMAERQKTPYPILKIKRHEKDEDRGAISNYSARLQ